MTRGGGRTTTQYNGAPWSVVTKNPLGYRGYYYDSELGFYCLGTRYYDQNTHRFISPDRIDVVYATPGALTDKNLYAYCDNNPVMRVDYDGEYWHIIAGAIIGGAFEIGSQLISNGGDFSEINWLKVGIATVVGGISAACGPIPGALVSGVGNATIDAITQMDETGEIDFARTGVAFGIGAASSLIGYGVGKIAGKVGGNIKINNLSKHSPGTIKKVVLSTIDVAGKDRNAIKNLSWTVAQKAYSHLPNELIGRTIPQIFNSISVGVAGYGSMGAVYGF